VIGPVGFSVSTASPVTFNVPSDYWVSAIKTAGYLGGDPLHPYSVVGDYTFLQRIPGYRPQIGINLCAGNHYLWHQSGSLSITLLSDTGVQNQVECVPTDTAMANWRSTVWTALYNAAQSQYYAQQQQINAQIAALQSKISNVDTLTLRREENDEIMKCALRWLLGADFEFMPLDVVALFKKTAWLPQIGLSEQYGIDFTGNLSGLGSQEESVAQSKKDWAIATQYQDRVNFINQAIDWDNIIYFVYSYFWDDPLSWDFIRQIQHPDATRQAFLRAGSARIVLTVRQGWELAWSYFVEFGETKVSPTASHPYLTIAQQIQDYDSTNYPGIPPANPNGGGPIDDGTPQVGTTSDDVLSPSTAPVTITVADSTGLSPAPRRTSTHTIPACRSGKRLRTFRTRPTLRSRRFPTPMTLLKTRTIPIRSCRRDRREC
jgi:hypothetical protein